MRECSECQQQKGEDMTTYMRRVKAGVCVRCESDDIVPGQRRCETCRTYFNEYARQRDAETQLIGCCITCGKSAMKGSSRCEYCHNRNKRRAAEFREARKCQN